MKRSEAEKLLGGHATGTLSEDERRQLFAAALEHQEVFDALMDEEALRELLSDPAAKAQLLAALAPAAAPKIVPFWRRTGLLGAVASLLVASLAGIAYLRSPERTPPSLRQEAEKAPAAKVDVAPLPAQAPPPTTRTRMPAEKTKGAAPLRQDAAPPPPPAEPASQRPATMAGAPVPPAADAPRNKVAESRRAEAQDNLARKAEAPRPAAAGVMEVVAAPVAKKAKAAPTREDAAAARSGGVIRGVVGGVATAPAPAKSVGQEALGSSTLVPAPTWALESLTSGATRATVTAAKGLTPVLLKRHGAAVVVLAPLSEPVDFEGWQRWQFETRLEVGDVLDLYLPAEPVATPATLPETGPVGGFRVRIHPAAKKMPQP